MGRHSLFYYNIFSIRILIKFSLAPSDQGDRVSIAIERSLRNLNVDYLDLYLIHWPGASGIPVSSSDNRALRAASWKGLVKAKNNGRLKAIGVSNYTVKHIQELLEICNGNKPDVNQVILNISFI